MIRNTAAWLAGWPERGQKRAPAAATVLLALGLANMASASAAEHASMDAAGEEISSENADFVDLLQRRLPDINIGAVESSPIPGLRTVEIGNGVTLYVTEDGSHAIAGVLYALTDDGPVDPSEARRAARRLALLADVSMDQMIIFAPEKDTKTVLQVFTDTDCGYCRKLHADVAELNAYGIEVRYLAFPRMGPGSETYDNMVSAWCADNPRDAITRLKRGRKISSKSCENPVAEHYEIGQRLGIQGTPTMITADGELIGGYVPAVELAQGLGVE